MSRTPPYGYPVHSGQMQPNYYYDENDGYGGDYGESDTLAENAPLIGNPNVTEIYRRKNAARHQLREHYRQNVYCAPQAYYYEQIGSQIPQPISRASIPHSYQRHIPIVEERTRYYTQPPVPLDDGYGDAMLYGSAPTNNLRRVAAPHPVARPPSAPPPPSSAHVPNSAQIRRHPVTVRTPRYYRRVPASSLYKKPSALCLPVSAQPDPAVYRRIRRSSEDTYHSQRSAYHQQPEYVKPLERRHSVPVPLKIPGLEKEDQLMVVPQKDIHMTQSDVDAVLARYETIFGEYSESLEDLPTTSKSKGKIPFEPKVPPSLKHNKEQLSKLKSTSSKKDIPNTKKESPEHIQPLQVEQITTEVLDTMLSELIQSGCENKIKEHPKRAPTPKLQCNLPPAPVEKSDSKDNQNQFRQSFNYQDISRSLTKSQQHIQQLSSESSQKCSPRTNEHSSLCLETSLQPRCTKSLEGSGVTALHRSKSYIVSLIDRALSKELGAPEEKQPFLGNKAIEYLDARQAVDIMSRQANKMDKELCLEITQALTETFMSCSSDKRDGNSSCLCSTQSLPEEPLYVKQLKQLRWGHLRHIQMEVRRLEDLERFLDSCTSHSYM